MPSGQGDKLTKEHYRSNADRSGRSTPGKGVEEQDLMKWHGTYEISGRREEREGVFSNVGEAARRGKEGNSGGEKDKTKFPL